MENRLAEVVDKTVIERRNAESDLCSCGSDVVDEMCLLDGDDTCGSRMLSAKGEPGGLGNPFIEILEFTHFARIFKFNKVPEDQMGGQKISLKREIFQGIKVSVVMELV